MSISTSSGRHGGISPGLLKLLSGDQDPPAAPASKPAASSGALLPLNFVRCDRFHHVRIMSGVAAKQRRCALLVYLAIRAGHPDSVSAEQPVTYLADYGSLKARHGLRRDSARRGLQSLVACGVLTRPRKGTYRLVPRAAVEPDGHIELSLRLVRRFRDLKAADLSLLTFAWGERAVLAPDVPAVGPDRIVTLRGGLDRVLKLTNGAVRGAMTRLLAGGFMERLDGERPTFRLAEMPGWDRPAPPANTTQDRVCRRAPSAPCCEPSAAYGRAICAYRPRGGAEKGADGARQGADGALKGADGALKGADGARRPYRRPREYKPRERPRETPEARRAEPTARSGESAAAGGAGKGGARGGGRGRGSVLAGPA